jgi:serine/threonine-protein kinase RsbW
MLDGQTIELSLPNTLGFERIAMGCSATYAKNVGFNEDRIEDLKTAVAEACINAMLHGNKGLPDARVTVVMEFKDGAIHVEVIDKGNGIPILPGDPDIDKVISGLEPATGYGLFLIKNLVDQVEFNQMTNKGHVVRMVIKETE